MYRRASGLFRAPCGWWLDDWEEYAYLPRPHVGSIIASPATVAGLWIHEPDAARRHGALFVLTCHPFLSGRAGRVEALRALVEAALERGDVEFQSCREVARRAREAPVETRTLRPVEVPAELYPDV